jgi:hypothetical protein
MRLLLPVLLVLIALPASASAEVLGSGAMTHDDQWSRYSLPMTCGEPAGCTVALTFSYEFLGKYPDFKPLGPATVADTKTITVPAGVSTPVVETGDVLKGIAKKGGAFRVIVEGGGYSERSFGSYDKVGECDGKAPFILAFSGPGKLRYRAKKGDTFDRVSGPVTRQTFVTQGSDYEVRDGTVSYSYRGVTYTFAEGATFGMTCTGNTDVAGGAGVLSPFLRKGKVTVKADKIEMKQPAAWIVTDEGNLGTRARETTSFVVSRRGTVSTLAVKKGTAGTITPWNSPTRSPCTAGHKLRVNRKGVISSG